MDSSPACFLNRGGSPEKLASVEIKGDELLFHTAGAGTRPGQTHHAKLKGARLVGEVALGDRMLSWVGAAPGCPPANPTSPCSGSPDL